MRVLSCVIVALCVVAAAPGIAAAKGAQDVVIKGPGLRPPVRFVCCQAPASDDTTLEEREGNPNEVAEATGVYASAFRTSPDPISVHRPVGALGPRYRVAFGVSAGANETTVIHQDVYPFAKAGVVTYTPPRQRLFGNTMRSGWYVSAPQPAGGGMTTEAARALFASLGITPHAAREEAT